MISTVESMIVEIAKYLIPLMKSHNTKWTNHINTFILPDQLKPLQMKEGFFAKSEILKDFDEYFRAENQ